MNSYNCYKCEHLIREEGACSLSKDQYEAAVDDAKGICRAFTGKEKPLFNVKTEMDFEPFCKACPWQKDNISTTRVFGGWIIRISCENIHKCRQVSKYLKEHMNDA